jgi:hypothetical protein
LPLAVHAVHAVVVVVVVVVVVAPQRACCVSRDTLRGALAARAHACRLPQHGQQQQHG